MFRISRMFKVPLFLLVALLTLATACASPAAAPTPTVAPKAAATVAPPAPTAAPTQAAATAAPTAAPTAAAKAPTAAPTAAATKPSATTAPAAGSKGEIILATTTSTQDSGLLDQLLPVFQKQSGYNVKTIAVGSGQAMTMGERGEADVMLVHAPDSEKAFMAAEHGVDRRLVMHNDFMIIGPTADPAKIKGEKSATAALKKIADVKSIFASRGDNSGTDQLEKKLWKALSVDPKGQSWYQETGQGMGATLNVAAEKTAYTISDRATYLANMKNLKLEILVEGDQALLNIYHVMGVNPKTSDKINAAGAKAFGDFMVSKEAQELIAKFGVDKYGQPLFFADAGKPDN